MQINRTKQSDETDRTEKNKETEAVQTSALGERLGPSKRKPHGVEINRDMSSSLPLAFPHEIACKIPRTKHAVFSTHHQNHMAHTVISFISPNPSYFHRNVCRINCGAVSCLERSSLQPVLEPPALKSTLLDLQCIFAQFAGEFCGLCSGFRVYLTLSEECAGRHCPTSLFSLGAGSP